MSTIEERARADADDSDRFPPDRGRNERAGVASVTGAPERPLAPDTLNGLTGAAYSDVIRREGPTDYLRGYRDGLNAVLDAIARDPLFEATNVPDHNNPELGFDKTAALSEPDEDMYGPFTGALATSAREWVAYGRSRLVAEQRRCPDCEQGKHGNCTNEAWDTAADLAVPCPCGDLIHGSRNQ